MAIQCSWKDNSSLKKTYGIPIKNFISLSVTATAKSQKRLMSVAILSDCYKKSLSILVSFSWLKTTTSGSQKTFV